MSFPLTDTRCSKRTQTSIIHVNLQAFSFTHIPLCDIYINLLRSHIESVHYPSNHIFCVTLDWFNIIA